jgi:pimeloyl-ACP methyl ester carboxylesterase
MARKARPGDSGQNQAGEDDSAAGAEPRDVTYRSSDGLALHVRDYGDPIWPWLPVVCLPGLTRTARDFEDLAAFLATRRHRPRRVVAFDYRGRGGSQWDKNSDNYNPLTEMTDIFDGMDALGISRAVVVGTSRGGIIGMLMGVARPSALAGLVLNDIGPLIEPRGLARIKSYVGRTPPPDDWQDAVKIQQRLHGAEFTAFGEDDWTAFVRATYRDVEGRPVADYDPALSRTLDGVEFDRPVPVLWNEFNTLRSIPVLAMRGENSDLLSEKTLAAMAAAHPRFEAITVPGEGHPPRLRQTALLQRISMFLTSIEGAGPPAEAVIPRAHVPYDLENAPASSRPGSETETVQPRAPDAP